MSRHENDSTPSTEHEPQRERSSFTCKRAGCTPHEILLRKEIAALRQEIAALPPGPRRDALSRQLALLLLQLCERN